MSVVVSLQEVGPCRKQLTVEVPAPAVEAETQRVIQEYGKRAHIPGFRKGKVPADVVRRRFAKDIEQEVVDRLLPRYWRQAQAESSIDPLLPPEVDEVRERQPGEPLTFVATVETRPQIELRNFRDFQLPDPPVEPGTLEVDEAVENLRRQLGTWVPVERPASRGDSVSARIAEIVEGQEPGEGDPVEIEVGDPRVWEELTLALSGLAAGQETTFTRQEVVHLHGPGEHEHEHGAHETRERHFRVRVDAVKERELAPLDDDFVARISPDLKTVDDLRDAFTRRLRDAKAEQRREQRQIALLDQLRERHPLELPQGVVQRELEGMVQEYAETLARRGVDLDRAGIDWNHVAGDMMPLAERRVHERLLLDAIAESESIDITDEEFERALAAVARAQGTSTPALRRSLDEDGRLAGFRAQLRREKTKRTLLGEETPLSQTTQAAQPEAEPALEV
jgi:trigger factor